MSEVRKSLLLSATNSYVGLVLQVASTVVIARILTPAEAGVFAVAAVFAALGSMFRDFGVAEYLIQKREVNAADIRASFAVNLAVSWLVGLALLLLAPVAAAFYKAPGVGDVMRVQALNFAFIPFGAVTLAWFRREMNFAPILRASIAANVVQFITAVGMALSGFGYMSLAWSSLAGVVTTVAVASWHRPNWFPRRPSTQGVAEVLHFGKFASGVFVASHLSRGSPELILGKSAGMAEVGMFSRAAGVVELFERVIGQVVSQVCLPYLARGVRADGSVVPSLRITATLLTGVGWPFVLFLALAAFPAIRLMYGTQWLAAVQVAQVMCLVVAVEMVYRYANQALFSLGKAKEANRLQLTQLVLRLAGLALSFHQGLIGAALGLLAAALVGLFVSHRTLRAHAGLTSIDMWAACKPSLLLAALAIAPYAAIAYAWPVGEWNYVRHILVGGALTIATWALAARALKHPIWDELVRLLGAAWARLRKPSEPAS